MHLVRKKIFGAHGWKNNIWCTLVEQQYLEHMGGKKYFLVSMILGVGEIALYIYILVEVFNFGKGCVQFWQIRLA